MNSKKKALADLLQQIGVLRFGQFTLRSGVSSSVYVDLRSVVAYPRVLRALADVLWDRVQEVLQSSLLCGVPYTALPIATCISLDQNIPMLICRKEAKEYGLKKQVEGVFVRGQNCLVVEDVLTTGGSVLRTIRTLEQQGLHVSDVAVCVDREQGGREALEQEAYRVHSAFTLKELECTQVQLEDQDYRSQR